MARKKSRLRVEQEKAEVAVERTNKKIEELGGCTGELYDTLNEIQNKFDKIRGVPNDEILRYNEIKAIRLNWKKQVDTIENKYKQTVAKNAGKGAAGAGAGVAVLALGPSAAMGVATTFGVASTGTAISSLSGAAATNAALAWLGGGALASGGGGMALGSTILALMGPMGIAIAAVALLGSGAILVKSNQEQKALEDIFAMIIKRDVKSFELAIVELNERIERIKSETLMLKNAIQRIEQLGFEYDQMTEDEQYELISYVNLMYSSTQLLVNPILGLQPKYTEEDFEQFLSEANRKRYMTAYLDYKEQIIYLANLLYKVILNVKERQVLHKSLRNNKDLRRALKISKKNFRYDIIDMTIEVLKYQADEQAKANEEQ